MGAERCNYCMPGAILTGPRCDRCERIYRLSLLAEYNHKAEQEMTYLLYHGLAQSCRYQRLQTVLEDYDEEESDVDI